MKLIPQEPPSERTPEERAERARRVRAWLTRSELPARVADWPEEWRDAWEERAALMEHLGGLARDEAERRAEARVRLECARPPGAFVSTHMSNADAGAAGLSQPARPRRGPNRAAETRTGQPGGGVGLPRAVGGRTPPDPTPHDGESTP